MNFDDAVQSIGRITELRRVAGAHVKDHRQLDVEELKSALIDVKRQYLDKETVQKNLEQVLYLEPDTDLRVLSRLMLIDVLLNQYGSELDFKTTEERVMGFEQSIVDDSNNLRDIVDLACISKDSPRYKNLDLYRFVLQVAWENENSKSADEVNLLRKLRERLNITEADHRILEAKLGVYPKSGNELHSRTEINEARKKLQSLGLLFAIKDIEDDTDVDLIPSELAFVIRQELNLQLRVESYKTMMEYRAVRGKSHLTNVLTKAGVEFNRSDNVERLVEYVVRYVSPSKSFTSISPRYGLTNDQLATWCRDLNEPVSGTTEERIQRILDHFDQLRPQIEQETDHREQWYEFYEELGKRDHETLRAQHIIDKDLEIEAMYEDATKFLFAEKMKHQPLHQPGSNHCDGLLGLGAYYFMWDNKSKESPVRLRDHIRQFDEYMDQADKQVPIFLVIGPEFTDTSESEAIKYHSIHFDRNIVLITSDELKSLAEEWSSSRNKKKEEPFPLGMLASSGRFSREKLGNLI